MLENKENGEKNKIVPSEEQKVLEAVRSLRYGSVEVIVHDSKIVQIEKKEKLRL